MEIVYKEWTDDALIAEALCLNFKISTSTNEEKIPDYEMDFLTICEILEARGYKKMAYIKFIKEYTS